MLVKITQQTNDFVKKGIALYEKGKYYQAIGYFQRAANKGNPKGVSHLAKAYHEGKGVVADPGEVKRLFTLVETAANQGNSVAQIELSWMSKNGYGFSLNNSTNDGTKASSKEEKRLKETIAVKPDNIQIVQQETQPEEKMVEKEESGKRSAAAKLEHIKALRKTEKSRKITARLAETRLNIFTQKTNQYLDRKEKPSYRNRHSHFKKGTLAIKLDELCCIEQNKYGYKYINHRNLVSIKNLIRANWNNLTLRLVLKVLQKVSVVQEGKRSQCVIETITILLLERLSNLISSARIYKDLSASELSTIFNILPNLSVYHEDFKNLHESLLDHTALWIQIHGNNEIELNVSALNTIAALSLPAKEELVRELIYPFIKDSDNIENLTSRQLNNLFEAFVYIKLSLKIKIKISLSRIDEYLLEKAHDHRPTISFAQKYIHEKINSFLLPQYQEELRQEHLVGPYRLDLAIPSKKIAFETDGAHHHKLGRLRSKDQLRDWVLKKYYKYTVFRFSKISLNNPFALAQALRPIAELLKPKVYAAENKKLASQNKAVLKQDLISFPQDPINLSTQMQRFYFSNKSPSARMQKKFIASRSAVFVDQNRLFCLAKSSDSELPLKRFSVLLKQIHIKRLLTLWNTIVFPEKTLPQIMQNKVTPEKLENLEAYITKKLRSLSRLKKDSSLHHAGFYRKKPRPFVFPKAPSLKMQKKFTACHSSIAIDQNRLLCFIYSSEPELSLKKFDTMLKKVGADRLHMLWNTGTSFGKPLSQRSRYKMKAKKVKCLMSNMAIDLAVSPSLNQDVIPPQKRNALSIKKIAQKPPVTEAPQGPNKFTHVANLSSSSPLSKSSNTVPHKPVNMNIPMQMQPLPISGQISSNMRKSFATGKSDIVVDQKRLFQFLTSSSSQLSLRKFNKILKKTSTDRLKILWDTNTPCGKPLSEVSQNKMAPGKLSSLKSRLGINLTAPASSNCYSIFSAVNSEKSMQKPLAAKSIQPPPATKSIPQAPVVKPIQQHFTSKQSSSSSLQPLPSGPMQTNWSDVQRKFMAGQDSIETDQQRLIYFLRMSDKQFPLHHFSFLLQQVNITRLRGLYEKNISNGKSLLQEKPKKVVQEKWYRLQKRITDNSAVFASSSVATLSASIGIFASTSPSSMLSYQSSSSLPSCKEQKPSNIGMKR